MAETAQDIYSLLSRPYTLLVLAFILDLCIGDPRRLPHPVRIMGRVIAKMENLLLQIIKSVSSEQSAISKRLAGVVLVLIMTGSTYYLSYVVNSMLFSFHFSFLVSYLSLLVMIYLISTTIATKELIDSARSVIAALKDGNIEDARKNLKHIVGRDTDLLDEKGITQATIESLSENASDGIIAPLFYFAIGGLPLAMTYKAINTMDSMVGYKNDKYRYFGWAAARLDDIANFVPARITGVLIVIATGILEFRDRGLGIGKEKANPQPLTPNSILSLEIMLRDGRNHPSPNSGVPEAAMAGALGIRLGGRSTYGGAVVAKPYIGESRNEDCIALSEKAINIVRITSVLGAGIAAVILSLKDLV